MAREGILPASSSVKTVAKSSRVNISSLESSQGAPVAHIRQHERTPTRGGHPIEAVMQGPHDIAIEVIIPKHCISPKHEARPIISLT